MRIYHNTGSPHPAIVLKNLVKDNRRISDLSSSKDVLFYAAVSYHNEALVASGFMDRISYTSDPNLSKGKRH